MDLATTGAGRSIASYLSLFKPRIVLLLLAVAGLSAVTAQKGFPAGGRLGLLLVGAALASAGASALNHYLDRDMDALMERTRQRPLPAGRIRYPGAVAVLGFGLVLAGVLISLRLNIWVALHTLLGALTYVLVYTYWLKRRSQLNVVIGGAAGSFAVLAGWAAVEPGLSPLAGLTALLIFLWTPLHFWNFVLVYSEDYRQARVPMLPAVKVSGAWRHIAAAAIGLFIVSLLPWLLGYTGRIYLISALALGGLLWGNLRSGPGDKQAWRNYKLSGPYLLGILAAMALDAILRP